MVVIKVVVVSSSPGGDVKPPFLPDWPDLGADEEVMAVVRTPGDITVKAGSTDGTAWVGLVVVPESSHKSRHKDKQRHTKAQYLEGRCTHVSHNVINMQHFTVHKRAVCH